MLRWKFSYFSTWLSCKGIHQFKQGRQWENWWCSEQRGLGFVFLSFTILIAYSFIINSWPGYKPGITDLSSVASPFWWKRNHNAQASLLLMKSINVLKEQCICYITHRLQLHNKSATAHFLQFPEGRAEEAGFQGGNSVLWDKGWRGVQKSL